MAQNIIGAVLVVAEKWNVKRIKIIRVKSGGDHFNEPESLEYCLQMAAEGTAAKGSRIRVDILKAKAECLGCGFVFIPGSDLNTSRQLVALDNHETAEVIPELD